LINAISKIDPNDFADGTAIGVAIATALLRLEESVAKTKLIILISDGVNNCGDISPEDATEVAKQMDVKIYTIGIGKANPYQNDKYDVIGVDATFMQNISYQTGGQFFHADNKQQLEKIYDEIGKLEPTKYNENILIKNYSIQKYFILFALLLVLLDIYMKATIFRYL